MDLKKDFKNKKAFIKVLINSAMVRKTILVVIDIIMAATACIFIFAIIPQGSWGATLQENVRTRNQDMVRFLWVMLLCIMAVRLILRIYNSIWRYAETTDYLKIVVSDYIACCMSVIIIKLAFRDATPVYFIALVFLLELLLTLCTRFFYKYIRSDSAKKPTKDSIYVAIVGAGNAGITLINEIQKDETSKYIPYCLFDSDPSKIGMRIQGVKIKGTDSDIQRVLAGSPVRQIIIAIPSMPIERRKELFDICSKTGCKVKIFEYAIDRMEKSGSHNLGESLRDINPEDFMRRKSVNLDLENVRKFIQNKTVLVTGGGGSIGSELCRQIAEMNPKRLVILDNYENTTSEIQHELEYKYLDSFLLNVEIATVRDKEKLEYIFEKYKPEIVYHAAAHKHVPLMEICCDEAIMNNVIGTYNVVETAEKYGVRKMILISTDKAVNPTNLYGATKRLCEMIIQAKKGSKTNFAAVRFGNVINSNGSVIPLFKKQIDHGGPVTITDKRIIRYFMSIAEAVQLVITTSIMASDSEIFVLDMGEPVKILDLAESMIKMAGLKPYKDVAIIETGLRPGEKLYEELLMKTEKLSKTKNDKIFIEKVNEVSYDDLMAILDKLNAVVKTRDSDMIRETVMEIVPTYKMPEDVNGQFEGKEEVLVETVKVKINKKAKNVI